MEEKSNILFLDFDGVLNSMRSFWKKFADHYGIEWAEDDFDMKWVYQGHQENMNPELWKQIEIARSTLTEELGFPDIGMYKWPHEEEAIENLNTIVEENKAKVVICSSWRTGRTVEELQEILDGWGAKCEVIDKTTHIRRDYNSRGLEILEWVMQNRKMIKGICILDDEATYDINAIFEKWAVQEIDTNKHGLLESHIQVAKKCFEIPIRPLYDFDKWLPDDMLKEGRKEDGEKPPSGWGPLSPPRGDMDAQSYGDPLTGEIQEKWVPDMKRCKTCKHWKQTTFYEYDDVVNEGKCSQIRDKIDIDIHYGWNGGYINYIETEDDFGCTLHEEK